MNLPLLYNRSFKTLQSATVVVSLANSRHYPPTTNPKDEYPRREWKLPSGSKVLNLARKALETITMIPNSHRTTHYGRFVKPVVRPSPGIK